MALSTWIRCHIRLRRSHGTSVQRQPIDLILEGSGDAAVHLRADPDMALGPSGKVPQLLDLRVVLQCWVPHLSYETRPCSTEWKVAGLTKRGQRIVLLLFRALQFAPQLPPACGQASGAKCPHFCTQDLQARQLRGTITETERGLFIQANTI